MKTWMLSLALICGQVSAIDKQAIDELVEVAKAPFELPFGTAIAVVENDKLIYEGYFGYADIASDSPVKADTPFYIASVTKPFFALSVLLNEEQGKLDTSATLDALFPELAFKHPYANKINSVHLLSHTSGVSDSPMVWPLAYTGVHDAALRKKMVENAGQGAKGFGEFDYSNVGYNVLSVWYEDKMGHRWQDALAQQIFAPLKMPHTTALIAKENTRPYATPYSSTSVQPGAPLYLFKNANTMHSAGGLISTARDLSQFLIAQLNQGRVEGKQVFSERVIAKSQVSLTDVPNPRNRERIFTRDGYAWGWYTGRYNDTRVLHHHGGYPGASTHLSFLPDRNVGIAILNNEGRLGNAINPLLADAIYRHLSGDNTAKENLHKGISELHGGFSGFVKRVNEQRAERHNKSPLLSMPLADYSGHYSHPFAGTIKVEARGESLFVSWGRLSGNAEFYDAPETIRLELVPEQGKVIKFSVSEKEGAHALVFDGMTFKRGRKERLVLAGN